MVRRRGVLGLVLAALTVVLGIAPRAGAEPYTDVFDDLKAELTARRDALLGSTDRSDVKRLRAAEKSLAALDRPSSSLADDLATALEIVKKLEGPNADEIAAGGEMGTLLTSVLQSLEGPLANMRSDCEVLAGMLSDPRASAKVNAALAKADRRLASIPGAPSLTAHAGFLVKALASVLKCEKLASRWMPPTSAALVADGTTFVMAPRLTIAQADLTAGTLFLRTAQYGGNGRYVELTIASGFTGEGTYGAGTETAVGGVWGFGHCPNEGMPGWELYDFSDCQDVVAGTAVLTVEAFDVLKKTLRATFSFTATSTKGTVTVTHGTFRIKGEAFSVY